MRIGLIGGSGLDDPEILQNMQKEKIETPYGSPSSSIKCGTISGIDVCILARHGREHKIPPTQINNRANIYSLKKLGCTHIIATTAVGSLQEQIKPGDFVIVDQFIDFTRHRHTSFYEKFEEEPKHTPMVKPFSKELRQKLIQTCQSLNFPHHEKATVITIEGPRFSTIAESNMFRNLGADIVNMSTAPEAILANEAKIPYAVIAMSTDYDCWKQDTAPVSWEMILKTFNKNAEKVKQILTKTIGSLPTH